MHGKDVTIPKGTQITAYIEGNMNLDARTFRNTDGPEQIMAVSIADETGSPATVAVSSLPAGAEISVDGNFVGNTPSALNLPSGEHVISVSRPGYQSWQRKIKLSGGNVNLSAELVKAAETQDVPASAQAHAVTVYPQEQGTAIKIHSRDNVQQVSTASPGWIGVTTKRGPAGAAVVAVLAAQSPAATAGLKVGDTITKINANAVTDDDFSSQISGFKFGTNVAITYMRGPWASIVMVTVGVEPL
jgi:membrane-associated protease RseP (regulator of RpoE activity)